MSTTITAVPFLLITAADIAVTAGLTVISTGIAELPYIAKAVKEGLSSSEKIKIHLSEEEAEELRSYFMDKLDYISEKLEGVEKKTLYFEVNSLHTRPQYHLYHKRKKYPVFFLLFLLT